MKNIVKSNAKEVAPSAVSDDQYWHEDNRSAEELLREAIEAYRKLAVIAESLKEDFDLNNPIGSYDYKTRPNSKIKSRNLCFSSKEMAEFISENSLPKITFDHYIKFKND